MKGFVQNIENIAVDNRELRRVLYTARSCQLVVMALAPQEEIGAEVHETTNISTARQPSRRPSLLQGDRLPEVEIRAPQYCARVHRARS